MMYYSGPNDDSTSVTIRAARAVDGSALRRVAQRDSRPVPDGELLIAEVDGELQAAIALATGDVIADPFHRTAELVRMLVLRRSQLQGELRQPSRRAGMPASRLVPAKYRPVATIDAPSRSSSVG